MQAIGNKAEEGQMREMSSGDHPDNAIDVDNAQTNIGESVITPEMQAKINGMKHSLSNQNKDQFLDLVLKDKISVQKARDQLQKAVRTFET